MPVTPTYPGVYIEEVPSGVRTITGVSTSVTAFVGSTKRGPINKAKRILSYADFERAFGGLDAGSKMSYAVRQFYLNGGSDAWIVRLAKDASAAQKILTGSGASNVLELTALDEGNAGNNIEIRVDYATGNPASTFNLTLLYAPADAPADAITEKFENLSMNSKDSSYVVDKINGISKLVSLKNVASLAGLGTGTSVSGKLVDESNNLLDVALLRDDTHNSLRISVNGLAPVSVVLAPADVTGATAADRLEKLRGAIATRLTTAVPSTPALNNLTVTVNADKQIVITSGVAGETSTVRVLPGERNDISARLKLGTLNGGVETDAVSVIRPAEIPLRGELTSAAFAVALTVPSAAKTSFKISVDGYGPDTVVLDAAVASGATIPAQLADLAGRIQSKVRALKPSIAGYKGFTCTAATDKMILSSGTRGTGSSVVVDAAAANDIAADLKLLSGTTSVLPTNITLTGGNEQPYSDDAAPYDLFIADRSKRKGIYALESVDIFNLLCLPGVTDPGILMDAGAYCKERRAFMIVDAPANKKDPSAMYDAARSTALPKTDYAAVYYPWLKIADPLQNGKQLLQPPCGTIAGLYARTDSARGVWKAPAGTDATLTGVQAVDYTLTDLENGTLNPLGVNCIRVLPVYGAVAWGARTLRGADEMASEWKYIPIRRLALYIEESLYRGTQWVVFEPNDEPLWSQIRLNVGAFMHNLFR
ncbi:MAG: phage tail sheath subtilisin-like domain-containing protein, partial [Syntrophomonas sp.]